MQKPIIYYEPNYAIAEEIKNLNIDNRNWCKTKKELKEKAISLFQNHDDYYPIQEKQKIKLNQHLGEAKISNNFYKTTLGSGYNKNLNINRIRKSSNITRGAEIWVNSGV